MKIPKQKILLILAALTSSNFTLSVSKDKCHSKTIFIPRSITSNSVLELSLSNYDIYHRQSESCSLVNFYASYFYQKTNDSCELARYFLPRNKRAIAVREDGLGDVGSQWLGVVAPTGTNFSSNFTIRPRRVAQGAYLQAHADFGGDECSYNNIWLDIAFAIVNAKHNLCIRETNIENLGVLPGFTTATEALTNNQNSGRFYKGRCSKTGVDDVQIKLGNNCYYNEEDHIGVYGVVTIPTGRCSTARTIFEPLVGSRHAAAGVGLNADYTICNCESDSLTFMTDLKYRYVFKANERRSFDLINGDWSRFMQLVPCDETANSFPAINTLTKCVKVSPRSTIDFWAALHYNTCGLNAEIGYDLWWRQSECIKCLPQLPCVGIFDLGSVSQCGRCPVSGSLSCISQSAAGVNRAPSDAAFTALSNKDINRRSGAAPRALTHTVYGAISGNYCIGCYDSMLGIGGSYEFARCLQSAKTWTVWVKTGINF